jgi:very-short-patch-repair endonuclease
VLGHPFEHWRIDIAFVRERVAIEIDGWAWHMDVDLSQPPDPGTPRHRAACEEGPRLTAALRSDRHKGNALVRARWDLLRFTWHDLTNRPDYVVEEIRAALHGAGRRP